jgi:uncharacterized protein YceK
MIKERIIIAVLFAQVGFTAGCMSIGERQMAESYPSLYPGVRYHIDNAAYFFPAMFSTAPGEEASIACCLHFPTFLIDAPLCLVFDTVVLPIDAYKVRQNRKKNHNKILEDTGTSAPDPQD